MNIPIQPAKAIFRTHWFFLFLAAVLVTDASVILLDGWESPQLLEAGILFDFAILIPLLYFWCYRSQGKRALIRAIALACLGVWAAGHVVPETNHYLLEKFGFIRYVGLGVLVILEVKLVAAIYRAAFSSDKSNTQEAKQLIGESDMPPWLVKLMSWEASMWRRAWNFCLKLVN